MGAEPEAPRVGGYLVQFLVLLSINVPTVSFGLAMGWVSLASGGAGVGAGAAGGEEGLVAAAAGTFAAGLAAGPLAARALRLPRRPLLVATSAAFAVSWALTLAGGWGVVAARLVAGAAGTFAWTLAPLLGSEMLSAGLRGAAAATPVLGHNLGMLLMYLASDARLTHTWVVCGCVGVCVLHAAAVFLAPESPAFLAARARPEEAAQALARLRGLPRGARALQAELRALPPPERAPAALVPLAREMLSDRRRRRAFLIALVAVVGQEACGVLTLLQFAERVFTLAGDGAGAGDGWEPSQYAVLLGAVQLVASAAALYLVERVGRRPLVVWGALATGACLALAAGATRAGRGRAVAGPALVAAVAADSLALQPAPYALLADMFTYQYRGCAVALVLAAGSAGNAAETLALPALARARGLGAALALAAALTLLYAAFALRFVPETRGRRPDQIYDDICPGFRDEHDMENNNQVISPNKDTSKIDNLNKNTFPRILREDVRESKRDELDGNSKKPKVRNDDEPAEETRERTFKAVNITIDRNARKADALDKMTDVKEHGRRDISLKIYDENTEIDEKNESMYSHTLDNEAKDIQMNIVKEIYDNKTDEEVGAIKLNNSSITSDNKEADVTHITHLYNVDDTSEISPDIMLRVSFVEDTDASGDSTEFKNDLHAKEHINRSPKVRDAHPKSLKILNVTKHVVNDDSCEQLSEKHASSTNNSIPERVNGDSVATSDVITKTGEVAPHELRSEETRCTSL